MLKPYKFQQEIIDRFKDKDYWALLMEAGTGKTLIAINIMRHWFNRHKQILDTIIFCPIIVLENWRREIIQCSKIPEDVIGVVMGSPDKRLKIINDKKKKILIINYEATRSDKILEALLARKARVIICDESHKIKNHKIKTAKKKDSLTGAILKLGREAWYRGIMSGTPIPNPEDIWSQALFLDRGERFGSRHRVFKNRYFANMNAGWTSQKAFPDWRFIPSMEPDYKAKLAEFSVSMKKKDCIDLPDLVEKKIYVEPSPEMLKHYEDLRLKLITWIEGQEDNPLVVQNALTKSLRLAEVAAGYLRLEDESIVSLKSNPNIDALMEILEETAPAKVIVFTVFRQTYKDIARALEKAKIRYVEIHGDISTKQKLENVDLFNDMNNDIRVVIANPQSGGVGINLKSASYSVYYSLNYSLVDFEQSRARNYRSGSIDLHEKITHYFLTHRGMITEMILNSVLEKRSLADSLLDLREMLKKGEK